jgi:hypothetical protein
MQIQFNPSLASLAKQSEELISNTKIDLQGQEVRWYSPAVFNHVYGKMIVDEILAMLQELIWQYDADERYLSAQAIETARQVIRNRFE